MTVSDPRDISSFPPLREASVNGIVMKYMDISPPEGTPIKDTILFVHGFPEFWFEFRHQLVYFPKLGYRCIAPNTRGYNGNEPKASESDGAIRKAHFTYGKAAKDLADLIDHLGLSNTIVVGHDWGSLLVQRYAAKYSEKVSKLIILTTPYIPPAEINIPLAIQAQHVPILSYQLYFGTDNAETELNGNLERFINIFFRRGGETAGIGYELLSSTSAEPGHSVFDVASKDLPKTTLMSEEEIAAYTTFYKSIGGLNGPLQWYRMGENSFEEFVGVKPADVPTLFVGAEFDPFSTGPFAEGNKLIPDMTTKMVNGAGHWVAHEKPAEVSEAIASWLKERG